MSRFTLPRDIYYGPGALDELKVLAGHKKAMIFTGGSSMRRGGFLQKTEEVLKAAGLETALFEGIEPDPSIETVTEYLVKRCVGIDRIVIRMSGLLSHAGRIRMSVDCTCP